jgi:hypothetical protein
VTEKRTRWGAMWVQKGPEASSHLLNHRGRRLPLLFDTKSQATTWIKFEYGYIAKRADLRKAPHHWRMPKAVKVTVKYDY